MVTVFILFFTRFFNNTCPVKAMWYFLNEICCPPVHFHLNPFSKSSQQNSLPAIVECSFPNNSEAIYVCGFFSAHSSPLQGTPLWPYIWRAQDIAVGLMIPPYYTHYTRNDFCFSCNTNRISTASDTVFHRCIKCIKLYYRYTTKEFH